MAELSQRAVSFNRSFISSIPGVLQIGVVVFGLLCVSLLGYSLTYRNAANIWIISGFGYYAFLFLVSFWCFMTSFVIVLCSIISSHTAETLPTSIFYPVFHFIATIFYLSGTLLLIIETLKYERIYHGNDPNTNLKATLLVAGGTGAIVTSLYATLSFYAVGKFLHSL